jgi:valyl-tRNA synthetase
MIMMGLKFAGDVPFRTVYIHGLVRDAEGQKMSKSKGNVLDPIDVIDGIGPEALVAKRVGDVVQPHLRERIERLTRKNFPDGIPAFGTDALRFTFAAAAATGRDVSLSPARVAGSRNFCNKLWNAARYVLMNTDGQDCGQNGGEVELSVPDRWILSRMQKAIQTVRENIDGYRFDLTAQAIHEFTWSEYCDWYLELCKPALGADSGEAARRGTRRTLVRVLEGLLRLAHPLIPFITEEIWRRAAPLAGVHGETIMLQPYPRPDPELVDEEAEAEMRWLMEFVLGVRRIRGEMDISPAVPLPVVLQHGGERDRVLVQRHRRFLDTLARVESVAWLGDETPAPKAAIALVGAMKVMIPLADVIDKDAELARLAKELERLQKDLSRGEGKLANPSFVERAPATVVDQERSRVAELRSAIAKLEEQRARIESL